MKKLILFLPLFISSCAFIFNKKEVPVSFRSIPEGANVYIHGEKVGQSPFKTELVADGYYDVVYTKKGYANREFRISPRLRWGWACTLDYLGIFTIVMMPVVIPSFASDRCQTFDWVYSKSLDKGNRNNILVQ